MNEFKSNRPLSAGILLVQLLSLLAFIFMSFLVFREGIPWIDKQVEALVREHLVTRQNTQFFSNISFLGSTGFLFPAYLLVFAACIIRRKYLQAFLLGLSGGGVFLISNGLKEWFHRARPLDPLVHAPTTFSFPSGHSSSGMTFYLLCAMLIMELKIPRVIRDILVLALCILALVIGFSRIYLGLHYLTDVLAGFCLSFFWLASMQLFHRQLQLGRLANFASFLEQDRKV